MRLSAKAAAILLSSAAMLAALILIATPAPDPTAAIAAPPIFTCTVTGVHDGDGPIYCSERDPAGKPIKIRLQAVAAREIDETCSPGHPCPAASGAAAKATLTRLAASQQLRCEATGTSYSRVTAWCWREDGIELNCAMVRSGTALRWAKFDRERRLCKG